jgi:hypothetical protein
MPATLIDLRIFLTDQAVHGRRHQLLLALICHGSWSREKIATLILRALGVGHTKDSRGYAVIGSCHRTARVAERLEATSQVTLVSYMVTLFRAYWVPSAAASAPSSEPEIYVPVQNFSLVEPMCQGAIVRNPRHLCRLSQGIARGRCLRY